MGILTLITSILNGVLGIVPALTQQQTNGASTWGTLQAPTFPPFLRNNPLPLGYPWGGLTAYSNNPYTEAPNTGVVRRYTFTVSRGLIAPDGYEKNVILINGQFPGPQIEANWGDTLSVTVRNRITGPEEGTAFHWHGILHKDTPWFDGVPSVHQCPIAPGEDFTYTFKADLYGTSWYHSHYSGQYAGGLFGPLIIHGPKNADYDVDLGPVMLTDHYHDEYYDIVKTVMAPLDKGGNPRPSSDNNLINGKMDFDCFTVKAGDKTKCNNNAGISKFKFTTGKVHRLRLINAGADGLQRFSIDGHDLKVIANDFVPVKPYTTKVVTLGVGQRADVLVKADRGASNSAFWMRSNLSTPCSSTNQPLALAAIYYDKADTKKAPKSTAQNVPDPGNCVNDDLALTVPFYSIKPPRPATTRNLDVSFRVNASNIFLWELDKQSFRANYNNPVLLLAHKGNLTYTAEWNVKDFGSNSSIRIVVNNPTPASHPMHLHGHNMFILHVGPGNWDGVSITNPNNPQRRDTQMLPGNGHVVWQINADNPGVWPFHCHIAWHSSGGLYANILERPTDIKKDVHVPMIMAQTCRDWAQYTNTDVVAQIDSGL